MKAFKKLALVTAIAAAPFAQAEMTSIDDSVLSEMTGQAGISIELDTALTIDTFTYTDTDGAGTDNAGSIQMTGIAFGGSSVGGNAAGEATLKDLVVNIDVDGNNGIVINLAGTDTTNGLLGVNPVDFGLHVDGVTGSGITGNIASDINIAGNLGPIDVVISNNGGTENLIDVKAYFEVTTGNLDVDVIGLGITNLKIGQDDSPLFSSASAYREDIVAALGTVSAATDQQLIDGVNGAAGATAAGALTDAEIVGVYKQGQIALAEGSWVEDPANVGSGLDVNGNDVAAAGVAAGDTVDAQVSASNIATVATAVSGAVLPAYAAQVNAAVNPNNATNMAFVHLTVGTGDTTYQNINEGTVVVQNALVVNLESFNIDVSMDLSMGETMSTLATGGTLVDLSTANPDGSFSGVARSLGSISLDNLNLSGTTLKIYGH
ncbi:MAG: hypothetical protein ACJAYK_000897 [Crocinitomicaceae bacterium]|jgi:hypothetical protein